jgi:protein MAK11
MAKRKRTTNLTAAAAPKSPAAPIAKKTKTELKSTPSKPTKSTKQSKPSSNITIQIITGSYDRILHGITATLPQSKDTVQFADTFLFTAHTSAIRCLALSPPSAPVPRQTQKIILATGATDERINLYHISAHPPSKISVPAIPSLTARAVVENPQNRELGSLLHHAATVTCLAFPTRGKLLSGAEDSTIAVTRTRDWSLLSTIKAPIPKAVGRPSGDTAPVGGAPSGINEFAVHPSLKLMISVGKGEKCMRLWNLVTGKKAGVLNFGRGLLGEVGEGRFSSGEGRKVGWGATKEGGEEFCVGFERGVAVFGMDSKPKCKILAPGKTKIHQLRYITIPGEEDSTVLALSTEDGRVLFYSTAPEDLVPALEVEGTDPGLPSAKLVAQLGGRDTGVTSRIKDFTVLPLEDKEFVVVTGNSDGGVRMWTLTSEEITVHEKEVKQVGKLVGTYETNNRITCLEAFVMIPLPDGAVDDDVDEDEMDQDEAESSDSD